MGWVVAWGRAAVWGGHQECFRDGEGESAHNGKVKRILRNIR
jgi:hypothetical protein